MRCSSLHLSVLALSLALACSSADREAQPDAKSAPEAPAKAKDEEPSGPTIGAPAPALALETLAGGREQLPATGRASVLIFGSFS